MESHSCEKTRGEGVETPLGRAKVYPQDELLRGNKVPLRAHSPGQTCSPIRDIISLRNLGAWSICDA